MMRHNIITFITAIALLTFVGNYAQSVEGLFEKAAKYYAEGQYPNAIQQYNAILSSGKESSALYYNLATTHYKLNHVPESIYYYEKALQLNPDNQEAQTGLLLANQMKVDAITSLPKTWLRQFSDAITGLFALQTWAVLSVLGVIAFVLSFLSYYFFASSTLKRLFFTLLFITLFWSIATYSIAHFLNYQKENEQYAILFDKTVRVFSDPNAYSTEVVQLHEGTKVEITERAADWVKIRLADGKTGWTKENTLKIL